MVSTKALALGVARSGRACSAGKVTVWAGVSWLQAVLCALGDVLIPLDSGFLEDWFLSMTPWAFLQLLGDAAQVGVGAQAGPFLNLLSTVFGAAPVEKAEPR